MIRRPPRSPLFPYPRSPDLSSADAPAHPPNQRPPRKSTNPKIQKSKNPAQNSTAPSLHHSSSAHRRRRRSARASRSEEHTSELQSPCNLVCRLLLEKQKITREVKAQGKRDEKGTIKSVRQHNKIPDDLLTSRYCYSSCRRICKRGCQDRLSLAGSYV